MPSLWPSHSHHPITETREEAMGRDRGRVGDGERAVQKLSEILVLIFASVPLKGPAMEESSRPPAVGVFFIPVGLDIE
jgi:hypothetical protein